MGTGASSSKPPSYKNTTRYSNVKQLRWALKVLCEPPRDHVTWGIAFNVASAIIAKSDNMVPRHPSVAYQRAGDVAVDAAYAREELKRGRILTVDAFVYSRT